MADLVCVISALRRYESSDSESSSDEEWEFGVLLREKRTLRSRVANYQDVVAGYLDHEFKSHFRMSRATFDFLLGIVGPKITRKVKGCPTIPSREQLMITLWKMATMDSYRSVCDRFNVGKAAGLRSVRRVTRALFLEAPRFIQWPTADKAVATIRGFQEASGFPKTIGAIDGTHIRIAAPQENAVDYVNRKGFHSIQLQVVCDHKMLITHCHCGNPGSVHDQRVFRNSEVAEFLKDEEKFPADSHLVGDAAYELHHHLLVPFKDNGHMTARQKNFNFIQSSARIAVERCFGLLKGRMRSLLHCLPMTRVDLMPEYIVACCVIHNICLLKRDDIAVVSVQTPCDEENVLPREIGDRNRALGIQKRNTVMESLLIRDGPL